jgi:hypothetical protein
MTFGKQFENPGLMTPTSLTPYLTSHGHLVLVEDQPATALDVDLAARPSL